MLQFNIDERFNTTEERIRLLEDATALTPNQMATPADIFVLAQDLVVRRGLQPAAAFELAQDFFREALRFGGGPLDDDLGVKPVKPAPVPADAGRVPDLVFDDATFPPFETAEAKESWEILSKNWNRTMHTKFRGGPPIYSRKRVQALRVVWDALVIHSLGTDSATQTVRAAEQLYVDRLNQMWIDVRLDRDPGGQGTDTETLDDNDSLVQGILRQMREKGLLDDLEVRKDEKEKTGDEG